MGYDKDDSSIDNSQVTYDHSEVDLFNSNQQYYDGQSQEWGLYNSYNHDEDLNFTDEGDLCDSEGDIALETVDINVDGEVEEEEGIREENESHRFQSFAEIMPFSTKHDFDKATEDETNSTSSDDNQNLNIDQEIVRSILLQSKQRSMRLKCQQSLNKIFNTPCWHKSLLGVLVCGCIVSLTVGAISFLAFYRQIRSGFDDKINENKVGLYDDHGDVHAHYDYENDLRTILYEHMVFDRTKFPVQILEHFIDRKPIISNPEDESIIPFFWKYLTLVML
jgi:hypothetical protein